MKRRRGGAAWRSRGRGSRGSRRSTASTWRGCHEDGVDVDVDVDVDVEVDVEKEYCQHMERLALG